MVRSDDICVRIFRLKSLVEEHGLTWVLLTTGECKIVQTFPAIPVVAQIRIIFFDFNILSVIETHSAVAGLNLIAFIELVLYVRFLGLSDVN